MTETKSKKWNNESVSTLLSIVGNASPVSVALVEQAAETLGVTTRSAASKLRQLDREVASMAATKAPTFTTEESSALATFVQANAGKLTYKEIAEQFPGNFSAKQVQGKLLALELTSFVRPADRIEVATKYSESEEATFIKMVQAGSLIEDIAMALNKTIASVRGKALSLSRKGMIEKIPAQKESHAKNTVDPVDALGDSIKSMTVDEIALAVDKSPRGIKTLLTRRGIKVADYDGQAKKAKAEGKTTA
jgi:hypothetical protein